MITTKRRKPLLVSGLLLAVVSLLVIPHSALAQSVREQAKSLALVPEDAAMYGVMLHNKDQFDAVVNSKAYAKIAEMDEVAPMLEMAKMQWEQATGDPALKGVVETLLDGVSNEVFFYADMSYFRLMKIYQQANAQGSLVSAMEDAGGAGDPTAQLRGILDILSDHAGDLETPKLVIGLRVKDKQAAQGLVSLVKLGLGPQLAEAGLGDALVDEEVGGVKLVTLKLDGSMIPWEEFPADDISGEPGKYDPLIAKMKTMTLAVSMGIKDDFLLVSVGPTSELIGTLGEGNGLAARPEFDKLKEFDGRKLTSITYISEDGAKSNMDAAMAPLASLAGFIPLMLEDVDTDEATKKQIEADIAEFSKDMAGQIPTPGAMLAASAFSDRGFDSVAYNWGENKMLDGSKPLTLLDHLGGSPIMYMVARGKQDPAQYEMLVKWLGKVDGYMKEMVEAEGGADAEKFKKFRTAIDPLLPRLDTANRNMMMPALKDGQSAIVLDAQLTSTQWFAQMPESPNPLPMLELAMVMGVSDAELLKQGCQEYFAVAQEVANILHEIDPDEVPKTEIPAPKEREVDNGSIYYYMLPKEMGVDKRIAPNAGLSDNVAVLSFAPLHTKRILEQAAPATAGPVAEYKDKPLVSAAGFNFAALVDAAVPWIEYGLVASQEFGVQEFDEDFGDEFEPGPGDHGDPDFGGGPDPEAIMEYVRIGADVLKCFRGFSSVTYVEDDAFVTRGEWHFQDLE